jgi:hypothetical protein
MNTELIPFLIGAFLLLYALLGTFSRQSKLMPARPTAVRAGATILGIALVAYGVFAGGRESTPPAAAVAAIAPQVTPPQATANAVKDTPQQTTTAPAPSTGSKTEQPESHTANVEVHDMPVVTAKPQDVTVKELPDSVAKEIIKHLPVPNGGN